ncbi:MAG: ribose-5-phosphate isomerase RpiA [Polyangiaceae bacterium]|nr:ribose-5-phosphate isomerase RpiA [Polyangiaceae bacterium]
MSDSSVSQSQAAAPNGADPVALGRVAERALGFVADGMTLGLGTGRAAEAFIRKLGERVAAGLGVRGVPTSVRSEALARELGIPLATLDDVAELDVAVDGADEVSPALDLTKGLGGALLRERVVAAAARRFVVLVTPDKLVPCLGARTPIPIEIVPFALAPVSRALRALGARPELRRRPDGTPFLSDNGQHIVDGHFGPIGDVRALDAALRRIPGVLDHGLFLAMASVVLVSEADGVRALEPPAR